jgi:hypothetical protein
VLHGDLVAEVSSGLDAGVGDQRLAGVQFQREVLAQEPGQLVLDGLGFGLRSDEAQEMIIGVAGVLQPPVAGILRIADG